MHEIDNRNQITSLLKLWLWLQRSCFAFLFKLNSRQFLHKRTTWLITSNQRESSFFLKSTSTSFREKLIVEASHVCFTFFTLLLSTKLHIFYHNFGFLQLVLLVQFAGSIRERFSWTHHFGCNLPLEAMRRCQCPPSFKVNIWVCNYGIDCVLIDYYVQLPTHRRQIAQKFASTAETGSPRCRLVSRWRWKAGMSMSRFCSEVVLEFAVASNLLPNLRRWTLFRRAKK